MTGWASPQPMFEGDRRPPGRMRRVMVDASFVDGWACIAGVLEARDARVLFMDVLKCRSSTEAEQAAVRKAMDIALKAHWVQTEFRSDATVRVAVPAEAKALGYNWRVSYISRTQNAAAHAVAKEGLKLWLAGRAGEGTM